MRKILCVLVFFAAACVAHAQDWADKKYDAARTAQGADYLTAEEKEVYYYINLARMFPKEFAKVYIEKIKDQSPYHKSLYKTLTGMKAVAPVQPGKEMFEAAKCWALEGGPKGIVGHARKKCKVTYRAECCSYGMETPLKIVLQLLIDQNVASLGHRKAVLSPDYSTLGVSIQPHKKHSTHAVLDFE